jgi:hypothetical protein
MFDIFSFGSLSQNYRRNSCCCFVFAHLYDANPNMVCIYIRAELVLSLYSSVLSVLLHFFFYTRDPFCLAIDSLFQLQLYAVAEGG